ncbi:hypothetical protein Tco_0937877 [Tanacetum coccineum]|uniref:Integrase catalytic domain-containing protein n=1 Tax=Tanacetum coccineum TaxID=301880 RepID=A0ABQ5DI50_9ASTR
MLNEIESLKAQLRSKAPCFTSDCVKPKVLAPGMYAIDVKPIPHPLKNNRSAHLNYIGHLKESVETVREIVEEARAVNHWIVHLTMLADTLRVNDSTEASGSKPRSITKKNRTLPAKKENKKEEKYPRTMVGLNKTVRFIRTDNGTEFRQPSTAGILKEVGLLHQNSVENSLQQNGR